MLLNGLEVIVVKNFVFKHSSLKIMASLLILAAPLGACAAPEQAGFFSRLWSNITGIFSSPSSQACESKKANCLFCQIYAGDKPAKVYGKNDSAMVIRSLSGGVLAIPRSHIPSLKELREDNKDRLVDTLLYAAHVACTSPAFSNRFYHAAEFHTGARAYQTQFHTHMHMKFLNLIPAVYDLDRLFDAKHAQILAENDVARLYLVKQQGIENNNTRNSARTSDANADIQLRMRFKKPVPHLDKLDSSNPVANRKYAARIVDGILLATQTIARLYPDADYVTEITNVASSSLGGQTLDIRITLK